MNDGDGIGGVIDPGGRERDRESLEKACCQALTAAQRCAACLATSPADADDLIGEGMLDFYLAFDPTRPDSSPAALARVIIRRLHGKGNARKACKIKVQKRLFIEGVRELDRQMRIHDPTPEATLHSLEEVILEKIPEPRNRAIIGMLSDERSIAEIADELGIDPAAARQAARRVRMKVAKVLAERGWGDLIPKQYRTGTKLRKK